MKAYIIVNVVECRHWDVVSLVGEFAYTDKEKAEEQIEIYMENYCIDNNLETPERRSDYIFEVREIEVIE